MSIHSISLLEKDTFAADPPDLQTKGESIKTKIISVFFNTSGDRLLTQSPFLQQCQEGSQMAFRTFERMDNRCENFLHLIGPSL